MRPRSVTAVSFALLGPARLPGEGAFDGWTDRLGRHGSVVWLAMSLKGIGSASNNAACEARSPQQPVKPHSTLQPAHAADAKAVSNPQPARTVLGVAVSAMKATEAAIVDPR